MVSRDDKGLGPVSSYEPVIKNLVLPQKAAIEERLVVKYAIILIRLRLLNDALKALTDYQDAKKNIGTLSKANLLRLQGFILSLSDYADEKEKGLSCYSESLELFKEDNNEKGMALAYLGKGLTCSLLGHPEKLTKYLKNCQKLFKKIGCLQEQRTVTVILEANDDPDQMDDDSLMSTDDILLEYI